jgi:hypothetical protein
VLLLASMPCCPVGGQCTGTALPPPGSPPAAVLVEVTDPWDINEEVAEFSEALEAVEVPVAPNARRARFRLRLLQVAGLIDHPQILLHRSSSKPNDPPPRSIRRLIPGSIDREPTWSHQPEPRRIDRFATPREIRRHRCNSSGPAARPTVDRLGAPEPALPVAPAALRAPHWTPEPVLRRARETAG